MTKPPKVLVLVGPTASGKTDLLSKVFGPERSPDIPHAEVISADSMQAYRGMDIGTAKPDAALRAGLQHRLIDILDPDEQYTAGDFVRLADEACDIASREGRLPIVSGGTGFYIRNFICGLPSAPAADLALREAVAADLRLRGEAALRSELAALDPESAARIHPKDLYRLTRAVEILRATGRPLAFFAAGPQARTTRDFLVLGVERPRHELYARIEARVAAMFDAGLPEELARLRAAGYGAESPGMRAIGYREFFESESHGIKAAAKDAAADIVPGRASPGPRAARDVARDYLDIRERVALNTRRYAKRQMTFFKALPGIRWIAPEPSILESAVRSFLAL